MCAFRCFLALSWPRAHTAIDPSSLVLQYLAIIAVASAATEFDDIVAQVNNANTTWTAEVPTRFGEQACCV